jgi:hypothetical protein
MRRSEWYSFVLDKLADLVVALVRGDRFAITVLVVLIAGAIIYGMVTRRRHRGTEPGPEEPWTAPSAEEVARVTGARGGRSASHRDQNT